jgi:O-antigen/teichoic acid export membrane protein
MSRTDKFIGGLSLGYVNMALITLTGLWLTPFLLKRLGQHDYGLWLVGTQMLSYLLLMDLGIVALLPRETAYMLGRAGNLEQATDLPDLIGQTMRLVLWQMPLVITAAIVMWYVMPLDWKALHRPFIFVLLAFILAFPARIFQAVLQGIQDLSFLGGAQMVSWLLSTTSMVILVLSGLGLYSLAIGWIAGQAVSVVFWWFRFRHTLPSVSILALPPLAWVAAWAYIRKSFWVSVAQVAQVLLNATDVMIAAKVLGPAAVVPYVCTGKLIFVLAHQPAMLMQVAAPGLSEMKTSESRARRFGVCTSLSQAMLMFSGGIALLVVVVNQGFVNLWVGAEQYGGFLLTVLLVLGMVVRHWSTTTVYSIFSFGYERRISLTTLLDGSVTALASVLLIRSFGLIGIPIGSLMGACFVSLPANLVPLARESGVSVGRLVEPLWPWCWRFVLLFSVAVTAAKVGIPKSLASLSLIGLGTGAVYLIVMLPTAMRLHLGTYLRPRLFEVQKVISRIVPSWT